ncbi:MAG: proton extrusion protein PcxA [Cyanobacteria bacterium CRU_2_1]|nr:proton extrusion protein PcxA [Cyanobacteria bacterium RU_5_0]NJR60542.1 proton extrusion protein PcxA [Cyanobacteria bacterium CRU_2_1]
MSKFRFINGILGKHSAQETNSSALVPVSKSTKATNTANQKPSPSTADSDTESIVNKSGVLPRSIKRTINKIKEDLDPQSEEEVVRRFRQSRAKTLIAIQFLLVLMIVPLMTQQLSKHFIVAPIVDRVRNEETTQIFLNSEMKEEAIKELQSFEEGLKFEALIDAVPSLSEEEQEALIKHKAIELSEESREKSKNAVSNVFADLIALGAFVLILLMSRKQIIILKSFMDTLVYGLSDAAKAFILILITDIFVGFHSPHGWEVLLEGMANHLGIAANRNMIFLFIATVPVLMDTVLKYWIFRYLSQMSPSTVATLRGMNE